jgi:energy-coupling factor transport system ATP-binding protein
VVELGRLAGWDPLPLSVRDARRRATPLRTALDKSRTLPRQTVRRPGPVVGRVRDLVVRYGEHVALRGVDLDLHAGEVVALMGRNGAGKSTLLSTLVGLRRPSAGTARVGRGADALTDQPADLAPRELVRRVGLVPQDPGDLLWADSVAAECAQADVDAGAAPGTAWRLLAGLVPGVAADLHPRDLSEGQRLALALAVVLAAEPPLLLLDEPTRGLDYAGKARLIEVLRGLAAGGTGVLLATHDVELAAALTHRTVILADGEVVSDGPSREVVTASPAFAPQISKILAPSPWLTIAEVEQALQAAG